MGETKKIDEIFENFDADLINRTISIPGMDLKDMEDDPLIGEIIEELQDSVKIQNSEIPMLAKMVLGGDLKTIVHAPGNILFTNEEKSKNSR